MSNQTVYYFPFNHVNQYVEISKGIISDSGYKVKNYKQLFSSKNITSRKDNKVVLNWFEDRPYQQRFSTIRSCIEFLIIFLQLVFMKTFANRLIWVRHNFKPHNRDRRPLSHKLICKLLTYLTDDIVTLEPVGDFSSIVVPHPLYMNDQVSLSATRNSADSTSEDDEYDYLFFGTIKRYKRLHDLLALWPLDLKLEIVGFCQDKSYRSELEDIIEIRKLDVNWKNEYIDDEGLNNILSKTKFVFMPHDDGAMISSGTFYLAINHGTNIISFDSEFAQNKSSRHKYVHIVEEHNLKEELSNIEYVKRSEVIQDAVQSYGREAIKKAWNACLTPKF